MFQSISVYIGACSNRLLCILVHVPVDFCVFWCMFQSASVDPRALQCDCRIRRIDDPCDLIMTYSMSCVDDHDDPSTHALTRVMKMRHVRVPPSPTCQVEMWRTPGGRRDALHLVFREALPVGAAALALSACVDRIFYGRWELVPWNFFAFNVLEGGSAAYGTHPWRGGDAHTSKPPPALCVLGRSPSAPELNAPCFTAQVHEPTRPNAHDKTGRGVNPTGSKARNWCVKRSSVNVITTQRANTSSHD